MLIADMNMLFNSGFPNRPVEIYKIGNVPLPFHQPSAGWLSWAPLCPARCRAPELPVGGGHADAMLPVSTAAALLGGRALFQFRLGRGLAGRQGSTIDY
jgi:hypothetical protein